MDLNAQRAAAAEKNDALWEGMSDEQRQEATKSVLVLIANEALLYSCAQNNISPQEVKRLGAYNDLSDEQKAVLRHIVLSRVMLLKANLQGAYLREVNLQWAYLREADLGWANLQEADLNRANLWEADLQEADLREANLQGANLQGVNLWEADLREANLQRANLQRAYLQGADLQGADLQCADLREADLQGAHITLSSLLTAQSIDSIKIDASTTFYEEDGEMEIPHNDTRLDNIPGISDLRQPAGPAGPGFEA